MIAPDKKQEERIKKWREEEEEDLAKILSVKYKISYINLSRVAIELDALKIVPEKEAREAGLAVFQSVGKKIQVAIKSPNPNQTQKILKQLEDKGYKISLYMVSEIGLEKVWERYKEAAKIDKVTSGLIEISSEQLEKLVKKAKTINDLRIHLAKVINSKTTRRITETLEAILAGGISTEASDIHMEPEASTVRLRLRVDGVLQDLLFFEKHLYQLVLSRIKLISGLRLNVRKKAQDGRFSIHIGKIEIEIRVSTIPGNYGESVVMRLLNPESIRVPLEELGIHPHLFKILSKEIKRPNGMIITTGPTGSGKTTALYSILQKIHTPAIKIITIEDPIEYHLTGVVQTQTDKDKGYDFSHALRSILRQDPDVIMVGEIRDLETAKIALNAALTGHLVLSTLHTNNAAGTIPRLIDLGVNPNIIAPALNMAMAQRLIRRLCICKTKDKPNNEEEVKITSIVKSFTNEKLKPDLKSIVIFRPKGCKKCNDAGYKGRIGVFEAILMDKTMEKLIAKSPGESEVEEVAKSQGILTMAQDGILKVLDGTTSLEELARVVEV